MRAFAKGQGSTGTTGFGYVLFDPENASTADNACVASTLPTFALSVITATNPATVGQQDNFSNSVYLGTSFTGAPRLQYRLVAAALRVRALSQFQNRGGRFVGLMHPSHSNLNGANSSSLLAFQEGESHTIKMDEDWSTLIWRPTQPDDEDFQRTINGYADPDAWYMAFTVDAPNAAAPVLFEWEAYSVLAIAGNVEGRQVWPADTVGKSAVNAVAAMSPHVNSATKFSLEDLKGPFVAAVDHFGRNSISGHSTQPRAPPNTVAERIGSFFTEKVAPVASGLGAVVRAIL